MIRQTFNDIFEPTQFNTGELGIRSKFCKSKLRSKVDPTRPYVLTAWRSPYATAEANAMLEKDLMAVYKKYYIRTLFENCGIFW